MPLEQWRAQAPWSLGVGWGLVQAYLRPGRDPGMQGAISTLLSSKEIPPRGEVGGRESARCLSPSVCPGLTQPPPLPLREGQIFNDCPPFPVSSVRRALTQDAFCLGTRWGCQPQLRGSQAAPTSPLLVPFWAPPSVLPAGLQGGMAGAPSHKFPTPGPSQGTGFRQGIRQSFPHLRNEAEVMPATRLFRG